MTLEKLTAKEIVGQAGLSSRPEFYSGRGAMLGDLNSMQLEKVHGLVKDHHGEDAAKNFVEMVANMKDLAATNFLYCLYILERREWKYDGFQSDLPGGILVAKDDKGRYDEVSGVLGLMAAMTRGDRDETESIRQPFLMRVGYQSKTKRGRSIDSGGRYFFYSDESGEGVL